ncbi:MAG: type II toxin-antitoxin system RelE/ParE family toxin [Pseudomonadota bacterium]|nr:type II toxin-antitoxin system RelE/ParE family toxin [Pseudomonadota bacterium]
MIKSFSDKMTAAIFIGKPARRLPPEIRKRAREKLDMVDRAVRLEDLNTPASNGLKAKRGDRKGQHCIRINRQWRICFKWKDGDAYDVEIVDYH